VILEFEAGKIGLIVDAVTEVSSGGHDGDAAPGIVKASPRNTSRGWW